MLYWILEKKPIQVDSKALELIKVTKKKQQTISPDPILHNLSNVNLFFSFCPYRFGKGLALTFGSSVISKLNLPFFTKSLTLYFKAMQFSIVCPAALE